MKRASISIHYEFDKEKKIVTYQEYINGRAASLGVFTSDEEPTNKKMRLMAAHLERGRARSGNCYYCGKELSAYQTKMHSVFDIACLGCVPEKDKKRWWFYSDG